MSAPIPLPISSGSPRHHHTRKFRSASAPKLANSLQSFPSFVQRSRLPEQDKNCDESTSVVFCEFLDERHHAQTPHEKDLRDPSSSTAHVNVPSRRLSTPTKILKFSLKSGPSPPVVTRSASGQATSPDHLVLPSGMDSSYYLPSSLSPPDRMSHKPYKCPIPNCPKRYGLPSQLKYHMAMRHGMRPHTLPNRGCGGANGSTPWRTSGETEQRNEVHACHVGPCTRQFKHSAGLEYHLRNSHGTNLPTRPQHVSSRQSVIESENGSYFPRTATSSSSGHLLGCPSPISDGITSSAALLRFQSSQSRNTIALFPPLFNLEGSHAPATDYNQVLTIITNSSSRNTSQSERNGVSFVELRELVSQAVCSQTAKENLISLRGDAAENALHIMSQLLDQDENTDAYQHQGHLKIRRLFSKLSKASGVIPTGLFLNGVSCSDRDALQIGGYADIFQGYYRKKRVALKRLRVSMTLQQNRSYIEDFSREASIWCFLRHPNILPFLGIDKHTFKGFYCMVSPWMEYGNVNSCMETLDHKGVDIPYGRWIMEIAVGLEYLHHEQVVHGDLRGANVLIGRDLKVQLADFGLALFADSTMTCSHAGGAIRWICPQLLRGILPRPEFSCDIYSYACVCIEIYSRRRPFPEFNDVKVMAQVTMYQARPTQPSGALGRRMSDELWGLVQTCWSEDSSLRPSIQDIVRFHQTRSSAITL